ncbi:MAG: hypothetical protein EOO41_04720 [Methanobacteriota archaeon]|nr:MAG: hypothetical protein EOO41_04720 [Euryarchaeota archaeon]
MSTVTEGVQQVADAEAATGAAVSVDAGQSAQPAAQPPAAKRRRRNLWDQPAPGDAAGVWMCAYARVCARALSLPPQCLLHPCSVVWWRNAARLVQSHPPVHLLLRCRSCATQL